MEETEFIPGVSKWTEGPGQKIQGSFSSMEEKSPGTYKRANKRESSLEPLPIIKKSELANLDKWKLPKLRYLNSGEIEVLLALIESVNPRTILEIGVNEGLTAKQILDNIPSIERYYGVDVPIYYKPEKLIQRGETPRSPGYQVRNYHKFKLIMKRHGSFDLKPEDFIPQVDVVFIDGDHGRKALANDTALARAIVRPGGMIIYHDYNFLSIVDVTDYLDELYAKGHDLFHVEDTWLVFQRIPVNAQLSDATL